ncbi:MAG: ribosomal RNA small subunit methyltransferase A [Leptospiraceae bacterium]|nr:ribosomal RNA small subunit methyltransferase A [Leptospiraceae bacterium]MCP5494308.1 ribosomal RNA small subunit methyltransferase A [Leptospiraceae bacterium]
MSYNIYPYFKISEIKRFMQENEGNPRKKWGQNFLIDPNILELIMGLLPKEELNSIEIVSEFGSGLGALTHYLESLNKECYLFEIDPILVKNLQRVYQDSHKIKIIEGDVLKNIEFISEKSVYILGNLPYYITSPIITKTLKEIKYLKGAIFMVQKEFAYRLCNEISSFSVFANYFGEFHLKKNVSRKCFFPSPSTESSIIQYFPNRGKKIEKNRIDIMEIILKSIFWGKRKSIFKSVREAPFWNESEIKFKFPDLQKKVLLSMEKCGLNPSYRPEELSKKDYYCLIDLIDL